MSIDLRAFVKAYDVRGTVPDQLNVDVVWALGAAFAEVVAQAEGASTVVVGHDMRPSSPELVEALAAGITARGVDVVLIGLASTDGLYYASGALDMPGAMFTASHNPARYNGIKLCRAGARPVGQDSGLDRIREVAQGHLDAGRSGFDGPHGRVSHRDVLADYAGFLRSLVDLSGSRPLHVVVDAANGMGGLTVPAVLGTAAGLPELPLRVEEMYFELDGTFPNHEANPLEPKNLVDLQAAVREHGADIGIAFDGDADRCFVVDERGEPVSPSAITAMIAAREIAREVAAGRSAADVRVVHNAITSAAVPEIIAEHGAQPVRGRVGHSFVKAQMSEHDAVFGGEHSAHYYFRDFFFADTGMLAAMHVLAALGETPAPLSEVMAPYDRYPASGEINSTVDDAAAVAADVRAWVEQRSTVEIDELDGMTVTHREDDGEPMWWFNLRPSNTEPLLRLNVEAADEATMTQIRDEVLARVRA
ncbi:phosphomannomutase/phosphoglucomutase [Janibacter melonis]|uniref:Phosphomannomutase/phosphoglucomutase n=1 Tax=Janibacter melonis TaxID=262209 RepID=A0A5P8FKI9_9MICO|nr:phosphomannomutase/phosphoglucomutase [Janibacter melonis]MBD5830457.1 phosphomannomutase/phosphoglucomutase [Janibacter melonis]MCM3554214.1 phosphomannomutase/phosphoglucomutase [Janibacter melonis]QFQ29671.2 phosphomannomutase/phosphoglucomutase [Janibacter melonis]